jgi:hypothetical protein
MRGSGHGPSSRTEVAFEFTSATKRFHDDSRIELEILPNNVSFPSSTPTVQMIGVRGCANGYAAGDEDECHDMAGIIGAAPNKNNDPKRQETHMTHAFPQTMDYSGHNAPMRIESDIHDLAAEQFGKL